MSMFIILVPVWFTLLGIGVGLMVVYGLKRRGE